MIALRIPKTTYATVSYTRMISVEMPFADAHKGTPFGQKNGPAIALIGAGSMISAGLTAGGILGGMMVAGGVMSGLGGITGNKTLMTMGAIAGLAGGVGYGMTDQVTGSFNPFSEGYTFSNSKIGSVFSGLKDSFTGTSSQAITDLASGGNQTGELVDSQIGADMAKAGGNSWTPLEADTAGMSNINGTSQSLVGKLSDGATSAVTGLSGGDSTGGGGGLLGSLLNNKDLMGFAKGAADNYQQQPLIDAQVDRLNNMNANSQFELDNNKQRIANMQNQSVNVAGVDPNASLYQQTPVQEPLVTASINGKVMSIPQSEYNAYMRSKQGGLLQQGAA